MSYNKIIIGLSIIWFLLFLIINLPQPLKIEGDGVFYYSWLRSSFFDFDFNFYNELSYFSHYDVGSKWILDTNLKTNLDKIPNAYAYGSAVVWLPFFFLAELLTRLFNFTHNGYSFFYVFLVNFSSWVLGLISFYIVYYNLKKFYSEKVAFWSSLSMYLATPWIYYQFLEPSMSHTISLFVVCLFFNLVIKFKQLEKVNLVLLSIIIFLMLAVRWQNLLFLIVLLPFLWTSRNNLNLLLKKILAIFIPTILFWLSQFLLWKNIYGDYFLLPQGRGFVRFDFHGFYTLFSSNRGLFLWSPVLILAFCGFYFLFKKSKFLFYISISAFLVQWLINSSLNDLGGGDAYGARRFIETLPFLSLALAAFWSKYKHKWLIGFITVMFIIGNLILIQNYRHNIISHHGEFNPLKIDYFRGII